MAKPTIERCGCTHSEAYEIALQMIAEGRANPASVARVALAAVQPKPVHECVPGCGHTSGMPL